jgi:hypothetical protein
VFNFSPEGIQNLLHVFIIPLVQSKEDSVVSEVDNDTILQLMDILKNDDMIDLLEIIHQTLLPYY